MEHQPPADELVVQVSAAAIAAIDERSSTNDDDDNLGAGDGGRTRRTFSHSYKMEHRKPLVCSSRSKTSQTHSHF
jgi:KUP system potassium uptake protein